MGEESFMSRLKKWIRKHLEDEARMIEEIAIRAKVGEISLDDSLEIAHHTISVVLDLAEKYPAYKDAVQRGVEEAPIFLNMLKSAAALRGQFGEIRGESRRSEKE